MIYRANLSALMLQTLKVGTGAPVGDCDVPTGDYGPLGTPGEPGYQFRPYSIIKPMSAGEGYGTFGDSDSIFNFPYSVSSFGSTREQCEWICDKARQSFESLKREEFDGVDGTYSIMKVRTMSIGGVVINSQIVPHLFGQTDVFGVFVSKNV